MIGVIVGWRCEIFYFKEIRRVSDYYSRLVNYDEFHHEFIGLRFIFKVHFSRFKRIRFS